MHWEKGFSRWIMGGRRVGGSVRHMGCLIINSSIAKISQTIKEADMVDIANHNKSRRVLIDS